LSKKWTFIRYHTPCIAVAQALAQESEAESEGGRTVKSIIYLFFIASNRSNLPAPKPVCCGNDKGRLRLAG